jgi:hypothetical protein
MARRRSPGLQGLARGARERALASRRSREESRFEPRLGHDMRAPALLLSPHCDDAVLSCWSVLASGAPLAVVNVFAGVPAAGVASTWEAILGVPDTAARTRLRIDEDTRALAVTGRQAVNLPLLDSQLRERGDAPSLDELDRALAAAVTAASRVYAPAGIGGQGDHVITRRYARSLLAAGMPVSLYAELPYCIFHGWPSWVTGSEPGADGNVDGYWDSFLAPVDEMPPLRSATVEHLDAGPAAAKREAIAGYRASLNYAARRMLADPQFHAHEVRWELRRPGP